MIYSTKNILFFLIFSSSSFGVSFLSSSAFAWEVELESNSYLPEKFIGVSKDKQSLYVLENKKEVEVKQAYPSIHGRAEGDKLIEGDLKTPEGVYFITTKIHAKLDFEKYGSGAYALNYPNPIDRIKQKTGHGIWIHSKGNPIEDQTTEGCVAVDLKDFENLKYSLPRGTPVVLASNIKSNKVESVVVHSPNSSLNISQHKRISADGSIIQHTDNTEDTQATTENISQTLQESIPVAEKTSIETSESEEKSLYSLAMLTASAFANQITGSEKESLVSISNTEADLAKIHEEIEKNERELAQSSSSQELQNLEDFENTEEFSDNSMNIPSSAFLPTLGDSLERKNLPPVEIVIEKTKLWNNAWANRSESFFEFYDPIKYSLATEGFQNFRAQKRHLFKVLPWIQIVYDDIYALEGTDYWVTYFKQLYVAPNLVSEGTRRLYWQKDEKGVYKVVAMEWLPQRLGLEKRYLADLQKEIETTITDWTSAWLEADVDKYSTYYVDGAIQGARRGQEIFDQKNEIWVYKKPKSINYSNLKIRPEGRHVRVTMRQQYTDVSGYKDYGLKSILFMKIDDKWLIAREDWWKL